MLLAFVREVAEGQPGNCFKFQAQALVYMPGHPKYGYYDKKY